jgi:hypothetical protein
MPARPPPPEKPKAERLAETLDLLQKLQEVGVAQTDPGFDTIKAHLSAWVKDGQAAAHKVLLPRQAKRAEMILPARAGRAPTMVLKAI